MAVGASLGFAEQLEAKVGGGEAERMAQGPSSFPGLPFPTAQQH